MDGVHDMGGMQGFGPVPLTEDTVFDHEWQRRAFAMAELLAWSVPYAADTHRHAIERLAPVDYLGRNYFEKWAMATQTLVAEAGMADAGELASGQKSFDIAQADHPAVDAATLLAATRAGADMLHDPGDATPRFAVGQMVRVIRHGHSGHTRAPRYLRGRLGRIVENTGYFHFADAIAAGQGACPEFCYTVAFEASELWGQEAEGADCMHADLWEPYLDAV